MKIERHTVQACCGKTSIIFKTDQPLTIKHLDGLVTLGFNAHGHFSQAGILYVDNIDFILTGPIGSNRLQIKCKNDQCEKKLNDLEDLLTKI